MGRKKRGRSVKEARKHQAGNQEEQYKKAPHSFVFHRGHVGKNVKVLEMDIRKIMEPYTARKLQVRKKNVLKDFVSVAGSLNISHFVILSKTDSSTNLRLARVPKGPTLTFKVQSYTLARDCLSALRKNSMNPVIFNHHPLLVMNNFSGEGLHLKLMTSMFQNMFPSISVSQVKLDHIKRCVLLDYDTETKTVSLRHYMITVKPVGLSRPLKKLIKSKLPDLGKYADLDEYMYHGNMSESEGEQDGPHNEVTLPQPVSSRGNLRSTQSAIRLMEVGPRLSLQLIKIEEGLCSGEVMHHEFVQKTPADIANIKALRQKKEKIKQLRRKEQAQNVEKKKQAKTEHKQQSLAGMKQGETTGEDKGGMADDESDDDAEYYRQEVGQEPDKDLGLSTGQKRKRGNQSRAPVKRRRDSSHGSKRTDSVKRTGDKANKKLKRDIQKFSNSRKPFVLSKTKGERRKADRNQQQKGHTGTQFKPKFKKR